MKSINLLLFVLAFSTACNSVNKAEISSESKDLKSKIIITGDRQSNLDPFKTSIVIAGHGQSDTLITEIFAGNLNKENVLFNWSDDQHCIVTFTQQDDSKRILKVVFSEEGNQLKEE